MAAGLTDLTPEMARVLTLIQQRGMVAAGKGEHAGRVERINARTLDALARRGLVTLCYSGDGGMAARKRDE